MSTFGKTPKKSSPIYWDTVERRSSQLFDLATERMSSFGAKNDLHINETADKTQTIILRQIDFVENCKEENGLGCLYSQDEPTCEQLLEYLLQNRFLLDKEKNLRLSLWRTNLNRNRDTKLDQCVFLAITFINYQYNKELESEMDSMMSICKQHLQENILLFQEPLNEVLRMDSCLFHMIDNIDFDAWEECIENIHDIQLEMIQTLHLQYPKLKNNTSRECSLLLSMWIIVFISLFSISLVTKRPNGISNNYLLENIQILTKACDLCFPDFVKDLESLCVATLLDKLSSYPTTSDEDPLPRKHFMECSTIWLLNNVAQNSGVFEQRKRAICVTCLRVLVNLSSNNQELCKKMIHHQALLHLIRLLHNESLPNRTDFDLRVTCLVLMVNIVISYPPVATLLLRVNAVARVSTLSTRQYRQPAIFQILVKYIGLIPPSNQSSAAFLEHQTTVAYASVLFACLINGDNHWITVLLQWLPKTVLFHLVAVIEEFYRVQYQLGILSEISVDQYRQLIDRLENNLSLYFYEYQK